MDAASSRRHFQIFKLTTTNAALMKLTTAMCFWQYFGFSEGKLGLRIDQNHQLWVYLVSAETLNFERLFGSCICLIRDVPLIEISANLSHICRRKGLETPQKSPFHGCCIATKTFENL